MSDGVPIARSPSERVPFLTPFLGEGSPTKIDRKKLLEAGGPSSSLFLNRGDHGDLQKGSHCKQVFGGVRIASGGT